MDEQKQQDASEGIVGQSASTAGVGLLPCPFCGSEDISSGEILGRDGSGGPMFKQNMCMSCGATGPEAEISSIYDNAQCDSAWNKRTPNE